MTHLLLFPNKTKTVLSSFFSFSFSRGGVKEYIGFLSKFRKLLFIKELHYILKICYDCQHDKIKVIGLCKVYHYMTKLWQNWRKSCNPNITRMYYDLWFMSCFIIIKFIIFNYCQKRYNLFIKRIVSYNINNKCRNDLILFFFCFWENILLTSYKYFISVWITSIFWDIYIYIYNNCLNTINFTIFSRIDKWDKL